jgi:hypothetical protein
MNPIVEEYLGDGVYATFDGWNVVLDLRMQGNTKIYLEPEVFSRLIKFQKTAPLKLKNLGV